MATKQMIKRLYNIYLKIIGKWEKQFYKAFNNIHRLKLVIEVA